MFSRQESPLHSGALLTIIFSVSHSFGKSKTENGHSLTCMDVNMKNRMVGWEKGKIFFHADGKQSYIEGVGNLNQNYLVSLLLAGWASPLVLLH